MVSVLTTRENRLPMRDAKLDEGRAHAANLSTTKYSTDRRFHAITLGQTLCANVKPKEERCDSSDFPNKYARSRLKCGFFSASVSERALSIV